MSAAASPPGPAPMMPTLSGARRGRDRLDPALLPRGVGDVFLHRADGHGAVARLLDHAIAFAQAVLRADAAADLGEGVGLLAELVGLAQPALAVSSASRGCCCAAGNASGNRARRTGCSARPARRPSLGELGVDLVKILRPQIGRALFGHVLACTVTNFSIFSLGHGVPPNRFALSQKRRIPLRKMKSQPC